MYWRDMPGFGDRGQGKSILPIYQLPSIRRRGHWPRAATRPLCSNARMSKSFKIAVYSGDGIGPEVIDEALRVLDRVQTIDGSFRLEQTRLPWGVEYYQQHGKVVPDNF